MTMLGGILISVWNNLQEIRKQRPLIHNITNYVVMNTTANVLLALGASPLMAHEKEELSELIALCQGLVINIGTIDKALVDSIYLAATLATFHNVPIVIDPVGVGVTRFRRLAVQHILEISKSVIIKGNASEIIAIAQKRGSGKGVDSTVTSDCAVQAALDIVRNSSHIVCISGDIDYIVTRRKIVRVFNGHPIMQQVIGTGCMLSTIIAACTSVTQDYGDAAFSGCAIMGIAGEKAAELSSGPGSFQMNFFDALYCLKESDFQEYIRYDIVQHKHEVMCGCRV